MLNRRKKKTLRAAWAESARINREQMAQRPNILTRVLLVDDELLILDFLQLELEELGDPSCRLLGGLGFTTSDQLALICSSLL